MTTRGGFLWSLFLMLKAKCIRSVLAVKRDLTL